jgi:hypothetical protein
MRKLPISPSPHLPFPIPKSTKWPFCARLAVTFIDKRVCYQIIIMSNSPAKEPQPSYVKLAMRNMVRKGGTSLKHFALTTVGLLAVFVGLAYLTR